MKIRLNPMLTQTASTMPLTCPQCRENLSQERSDFFGAESCLYCEGIWLSSASISTALAASPNAPSLETLLHKVSECQPARANLVCPTCDTHSYKTIAIKDLEIDLCSECGSMYFDKGKIEKLFPAFALQSPQGGLGTVVATEVTGNMLSIILLAIFSGGC